MITPDELAEMMHIKTFKKTLWWKLMPGTTIKASWPGAHWSDDDLEYPEYRWGVWLREHVGKQGWDWDWMYEFGDNELFPTVIIKFRLGKTNVAPQFKLRWS